MLRMTVDSNTHNNSTRPRGRPSIDFTNMNILINNNTELSNDKPTIIYDLLCRDEPVGAINLTDEQKKDKYLHVIATTLSQLTARGDKVFIIPHIHFLILSIIKHRLTSPCSKKTHINNSDRQVDDSLQLVLKHT